MVDDFLFIYSLTKAGIFAIILVLLRGDNIMGYTLDKDGIKDIKYCDIIKCYYAEPENTSHVVTLKNAETGEICAIIKLYI